MTFDHVLFASRKKDTFAAVLWYKMRTLSNYNNLGHKEYEQNYHVCLCENRCKAKFRPKNCKVCMNAIYRKQASKVTFIRQTDFILHFFVSRNTIFLKIHFYFS